MDYSDDISFQRPDCLLSRKQTCACIHQKLEEEKKTTTQITS